MAGRLDSCCKGGLGNLSLHPLLVQPTSNIVLYINWPRRRQQRRFKCVNSIRLVSSGANGVSYRIFHKCVWVCARVCVWWDRKEVARCLRYRLSRVAISREKPQRSVSLLLAVTAVTHCRQRVGTWHPVKHAVTYYLSTHLFTPTVNTNRKIKQKTNRRWRCQYLWEDNNSALSSRL